MNTLRRKQTTYQFNSVFSIFYWSDGLIKNSLSRISKARTKPSLAFGVPALVPSVHVSTQKSYKTPGQRNKLRASIVYERTTKRTTSNPSRRARDFPQSFLSTRESTVVTTYFSSSYCSNCLSLVLKICGKRFFQTAQARVDAMVLVD